MGKCRFVNWRMLDTVQSGIQSTDVDKGSLWCRALLTWNMLAFKNKEIRIKCQRESNLNNITVFQFIHEYLLKIIKSGSSTVLTDKIP